jgi:hypothetical protein
MEPTDTNSTDRDPIAVIYYIFYAACLILSIYLGITTGFTGTHTPPAPFGIELFALPVGFILFLIDSRLWRSTKVHKIGLAANGAIMAYVLILAFTHT